MSDDRLRAANEKIVELGDALSEAEARLSTTEKALREISASLYLGDGYNELRRIARNALQPEHQKEPQPDLPDPMMPETISKKDLRKYGRLGKPASVHRATTL